MATTTMYHQVTRKRWRVQAVVVAVGALILWLLPYYNGIRPSDIRLIGLAIVYTIAVMGLNLVFGLAGQVTLGPAAVFAVGAYTAGILNSQYGWSPYYGIAIGIVAAAIVGLIIGIPALRVGGFYLAMVTALAAEAIPAAVKLYPGTTGGDFGLSLPPLGLKNHPLTALGSYRLLIVLMVITAVLIANVARTSWGRWFRALRSSEVGASAMGVSVYRAKLISFVLSAVFGGLAGGLYAFYQGVIDPSQFSFDLSLVLFSALVIGGLGSLWGPVVGTFLYVLGPNYLLPSSGGPGVQIFYGALLIVVMIAVPSGIVAGAVAVKDRWLPGNSSPPETGAPPDAAALTPLLARAGTRERSSVVLSAAGIAKSFGGVHALADAAVEVRAGAITALIGPNGSGKTTLLNVCCGYLSPDSGRVELLGEDVTKWSPHKRVGAGLGRSFQGAISFPDLNCTQTVMAGVREGRPGPLASMLSLPSSRRHEKAAAQRAEAILDALGLSHLKNRPVTAGSLAEVRVLDLARALALDPVVLVLDEPAAGLDLGEVAMLERVVTAARDAGVGVLLVEHDVAFVTRVADHITVLEQGSVIYSGTPQGVRDDPKVVEAYFGDVVL